MVKKSTTLAWMASLILAAVLPSCTAEKTEVIKGIPAGGEEITYTFLLEEPESTKTGRTPDGKTVWTEGETIWYFTDDGDDNMKSAKVRLSGGKAYLDVKASYSDDYVIAVCGTSWIGDAWRKGFNMWNVAWFEQNGSFASAHTGYASAKLSSGSKVPGLHFTNVTSVIRFETTDKRTSAVRFRANDGTPLCTGEPVEAWVNESLSVSQTKFYESQEDAVQVSVSGGSGVYYAGVIPCTLAKGFTVECLNAEGRVFRTMSHNKQVNLERGYVNNLGRLEDHYPPEINISKITLSTKNAEVPQGGSYLIEAAYAPEEATLTDIRWKTSNTSIATVDNGVVTGLSKGSCTITAYADGGASATCSVTVTGKAPEVSAIQLESCGMALIKGQTYRMRYRMWPDEVGSLNPAWTSSNTSVATVSSDGTVKAVAAGTAVITARYNNAGDYKSDACQVTVVTSPASARDLSASETANCYIVTAPGSYRFRATVKGNSSESIGSPTKAEVLWESFGTDYAPSKGELIANASLSGGYVNFSTATPMRNGNALIAVKNASGTILWSWHIWLCAGFDPASTQQRYYSGKYLMDRNLGATSTDRSSIGTLGLYYQWGRKDPFLNIGRFIRYYANEYQNYANDFMAASTATVPNPVMTSQATGTIEYATAHPMTMIYSNSSNVNRDWYWTAGPPYEDTRWAAKKTKYDPCPPGWRTPDTFRGGDYLENLPAKDNLSVPTDQKDYGIDFSGVLGSGVWYPLAGWAVVGGGKYRISGQEQYGRYWFCDSQVNGEEGTYRGTYMFYIGSFLTNQSKGWAFLNNNIWKEGCHSVRCQKN